MADQSYDVKNKTNRPIVLEQGTMLGARGSEGSEKEGIVLTERDRKLYVDTDKISAKSSSPSPAGPQQGVGKLPAPLSADSNSQSSVTRQRGAEKTR
jgi:hypothetical protein